MMAVIREIDTALQEQESFQVSEGQDAVHGVDISLLTLLASEPFSPHMILERLITDAHQD